VGEFTSDPTDIAVDHPEIVSHCHEAHRLAQRAAEGHATTDEEHRALAEYRELFDELLSDARPDASPAQRVSQTG
jgi:hypothetical protein